MKTTHNVPLKALCLTLGVHFTKTTVKGTNKRAKNQINLILFLQLVKK